MQTHVMPANKAPEPTTTGAFFSDASRFIQRVGGGSAFFGRRHHFYEQ